MLGLIGLTQFCSPFCDHQVRQLSDLKMISWEFSPPTSSQFISVRVCLRIFSHIQWQPVGRRDVQNEIFEILRQFFWQLGIFKILQDSSALFHLHFFFANFGSKPSKSVTRSSKKCGKEHIHLQIYIYIYFNIYIYIHIVCHYKYILYMYIYIYLFLHTHTHTHINKKTYI